jgi:hypothetical protein
VVRETGSVPTIGLEVPGWPGHRAGRHLDVRLTAEDGYTAERSYSIASADGEPVAITVVASRVSRKALIKMIVGRDLSEDEGIRGSRWPGAASRAGRHRHVVGLKKPPHHLSDG